MNAACNKPEMPDFMRQQFAFSAAVRDPEHAPLPLDVAPRRMAVYQELIFNNIEEFLGNAFPVLRRISSEEKWHALVRDFIVEHRARTPLFPEMPQEFLSYLEQSRAPREGDYPFMQELAHYEWAELALATSEVDIDDTDIDAGGSLQHGVPVLSPLIWLCSYHYPVHRIGPDFIPEQPGETPSHLLVYRNREDEVKFLELNPLTARLLQRLEHNTENSGKALLTEMATELNHPKPETVIEGGLQILQDLRARDVILGTKP